jgi:hypothetical protein
MLLFVVKSRVALVRPGVYVPETRVAKAIGEL